MTCFGRPQWKAFRRFASIYDTKPQEEMVVGSLKSHAYLSHLPIGRPLRSTSLLQDKFGKHTLKPPKNESCFFWKMFWDSNCPTVEDTSEKWKICWKSLNEAKGTWYIPHKNPHETAINRFEITLLTAGFLLIPRVASKKMDCRKKHPADSVG